MPTDPSQLPPMPTGSPEGEDQRIDHDARLAMSTLEPLGRLKARLQEPDTFADARQKVDINGIVGKIDSLAADLQGLAQATTGDSQEEMKRELEEESQKRSAGQAERQKRLAPCKPSAKSPTGSAAVGQTRRPQVSATPNIAAPRPQPVR